MNRAVFLDRDGVLNRIVLRDGRAYPPQSVDELELFPDVVPALERLRSAGFKLIVVTNQPDVATGVQQREVVEAMHQRLRGRLPLDDIRVCYHVDADQCACRKPRPGMLLAAAQAGEIDLRRSYLVGDRWRDIDAGQAAGCATIWIRNEYHERRPENPQAIVATLTAAVDWILEHDARSGRSRGS